MQGTQSNGRLHGPVALVALAEVRRHSVRWPGKQPLHSVLRASLRGCSSPRAVSKTSSSAPMFCLGGNTCEKQAVYTSGAALVRRACTKKHTACILKAVCTVCGALFSQTTTTGSTVQATSCPQSTQRRLTRRSLKVAKPPSALVTLATICMSNTCTPGMRCLNTLACTQEVRACAPSVV